MWLCSALGCVLLVAGLYAFLWGKNKEVQSGAQQKSDPSKEEAHLESIVTSKSPDVEQEKDTHKIWSFYDHRTQKSFWLNCSKRWWFSDSNFLDVYCQLPMYFHVWNLAYYGFTFEYLS